jgi:uncharacterized protein (TIGR02687 family)
MNLSTVKQELSVLFARELPWGVKRHIVFWYDDSGVYEEFLPEIDLENVEIVKVYRNNTLEIKHHIECENTVGNVLIYSPEPRPDDFDNFLSDTIRYSKIYAADETTIIMTAYKMSVDDVNLRSAVEKYRLFFRNKERERRFAAYNITAWTAGKLDIAVLSALCKLPVPNADNVIRAVLCEYVSGKNELLNSIAKFADKERFHSLIRNRYGFAGEDLGEFARALLLTHFAANFTAPLPWAYTALGTNGYVLTDNFMKDISAKNDYGKIAQFVGQMLNLPDFKPTLADVKNASTFPQMDEYIIAKINDYLTQGAGEYSDYINVIESRRRLRFYDDYKSAYDALFYACELGLLFEKHTDFGAKNISALWDKYKTEFYQFDYYYRKFVVAYDRIPDNECFKTLSERIENAYNNEYLSEISRKWAEMLDDNAESGVINWRLSDVTPQQDFYAEFVNPFVKKDERIVVIISDAFRYESAVELTEKLRSETKAECELREMFGVVPSYTALGMAALLPHDKITIGSKAEIIVDGINSSGTANREKILQQIKPESVAIQADEIFAMKKAEMSEHFAGKKLIYIYHNTIDKHGESSESDVFDATEKTFEELSDLVRKLVNNISAANILITADHGYIYRRQPIEESDKTGKDAEKALLIKRRAILTARDTNTQGTQKISMDYLAGLSESELRAVVPRGVNLFPVQGSGANYVHGGAALQEIMIPVVRVKCGKKGRK